MKIPKAPSKENESIKEVVDMRYMIESKIGSRLKVEYEDNYKDALITLRRHQQFKTFKSGGISEVQNLEEIKEDIKKNGEFIQREIERNRI